MKKVGGCVLKGSEAQRIEGHCFMTHAEIIDWAAPPITAKSGGLHSLPLVFSNIFLRDLASRTRIKIIGQDDQ